MELERKGSSSTLSISGGSTPKVNRFCSEKRLDKSSLSRKIDPDDGSPSSPPSVPQRPSHLKLKDKESLLKEIAGEDRPQGLQRSSSAYAKKNYKKAPNTMSDVYSAISPSSVQEAREAQKSAGTPSLLKGKGIEIEIEKEKEPEPASGRVRKKISESQHIPTSHLTSASSTLAYPLSSSLGAPPSIQSSASVGQLGSSTRPGRSKTYTTLFLSSPRMALHSVTNKLRGRSSTIGESANGRGSMKDAGVDTLWLEKSPAILTVADWEQLEPSPNRVDDLVDTHKRGFRFELGSKQGSDVLFIEDLDKDVGYYRQFFYGQEHLNLLSEEMTYPVILSIEEPKAKDQKVFKALMRTKESEERFTVMGNTGKDRLKSLIKEAPQLSSVKFFKCKNPELEKDLLSLELQLICSEYKFGILYAKENQNEDQMFSNQAEDTVPEFEDFLLLLGDKVSLLGWSKFRAGLDNKKETTGKHSIYTTFQNFEIMFHVSTFLPFFPNDKQQVERKRHLGNDVVVGLASQMNNRSFRSVCGSATG